MLAPRKANPTPAHAKLPYTIVDGFWHDGVWREPGQPDLMLTEAQAKYLLLGGHVRAGKGVEVVITATVPAPAAAAPSAPASDAAAAKKSAKA